MKQNLYASLTSEEMMLTFLKCELSALVEGSNYLDIIVIYKEINIQKQPICIGSKYPQHDPLLIHSTEHYISEMRQSNSNVKHSSDCKCGEKKSKYDVAPYQEIVELLQNNKSFEEYQLVDLYVSHKDPLPDQIKVTKKIARTTMRTFFDSIRSSGKNFWTVGESNQKGGEITFLKNG
ncbi:Uncharacterized protein QTN25_002663 [Entamoeba marina]